jgi:hypothetical protein
MWWWYYVGTYLTEFTHVLMGLFAIYFLWLLSRCREPGGLRNTCREAVGVLSIEVMLVIFALINGLFIDTHEMYPPHGYNFTHGECGLSLPPSMPNFENLTNHQLRIDRGGGKVDWYYVDLAPAEPDPWDGNLLLMPDFVSEHKMKVNQDCALISFYDIVKPDWAGSCVRWCKAELGNFFWNEPCAFGYAPKSKRMPMLVACQKAWGKVQIEEVSDDFCIMMGLLVTFVGHYLGVLYFVVMSDADARARFKPPIYTTPHTPEKISVCFFLCGRDEDAKIPSLADSALPCRLLQLRVGLYLLRLFLLPWAALLRLCDAVLALRRLNGN